MSSSHKPLIQTYGAYPVFLGHLDRARDTADAADGFRRDGRGVVEFLTWGDWANMFYLAVVSTLIATITWNYGASRLPSAAGRGLPLSCADDRRHRRRLDAGMNPSRSTRLPGGALILLGVAIAQVGPRLRMGLLRD